MSAALTLYQIEEHLQALIDTEAVVPDEQFAEFAAELAKADDAAIVKRDNCIRFIQHIKAQVEFSKAERKRLAAREDSLEKGLERFEEYVLGVVAEHGKQTSKTIRRLEGRVGDLCAVDNPPSVAITDEADIPEEYKVATVKLPLSLWNGLLSDAGATADVGELSVAIDKAAVKKALQLGEEVPGADLTMGGARLEVK